MPINIFFETIKRAGGASFSINLASSILKSAKKHQGCYCIIHARGSINNFVVVAVCNYHAVVDSIEVAALHRADRWHKL